MWTYGFLGSIFIWLGSTPELLFFITFWNSLVAILVLSWLFLGLIFAWQGSALVLLRLVPEMLAFDHILFHPVKILGLAPMLLGLTPNNIPILFRLPGSTFGELGLTPLVVGWTRDLEF